jgi:hypothetical protein
MPEHTSKRALQTKDETTLWTMLMHPACETSTLQVQSNADLARYVQGWGSRMGDLGRIAEQASGTPVEAALREAMEWR